jgi:hypothetical protein
VLVGPPTLLHLEGTEGALQLAHLPTQLGGVRRAVVPRRRRRRRRRRHRQLSGDALGLALTLSLLVQRGGELRLESAVVLLL